MTKDEIREYAGLARLKEDTGSVSLADTLGVISPLVATKVLEKMTDDEIRSIVNLNALTEEQRTTLNPTQEFSNQSISVEDIIISEFSQVGESTSFYNIIESRDMTPEDYQSYATALEKSILAILEKDPLATDRTIAEALKKEEKTITESIAKMVSDGLIEMGEKNQEGVEIRKAKVSAEGKDLAEDSKVAEMEVRYFYDWKTEIPSTQRDTSAHPSRPFCKRLMDLDKLYTRTDIDRISNRVGLNVFMYGGGWWNMGNGVNSPSCRHIWKSVIVKRK
jgi:DNA-binding MarR family transcriptional regulator